MAFRQRVPLTDLVIGLSEAVDCMHPVFRHHHQRVAYLAYQLAGEMGLSEARRHDLLLAGLLHDIGALSLQNRLDQLQFEADFEQTGVDSHPEAGWWLLRDFEPLNGIAGLIRWHHARHDAWSRIAETAPEQLLDANILFAADRVAVLIADWRPIIGQVGEIARRLTGQAGRMFAPEITDAFAGLAAREHVWFELLDPNLQVELGSLTRSRSLALDLNHLLALGRTLVRIIDFKSRFTATHSTGVAAVASALAAETGLSRETVRLLELAGYLHDVGKVAVPSEMLERPGKLGESDFQVVKSHPYFSWRILKNLQPLALVNTWASLHHERLDGRGYPFHRHADDLPTETRIVAVADVYTALTEDRPYRAGMTPAEAARVLDAMVKDGALDAAAVLRLKSSGDVVDDARRTAQQQAIRGYGDFSAMPT